MLYCKHNEAANAALKEKTAFKKRLGMDAFKASEETGDENMFKPGDMIIYGGMGVCKVEAVETKQLSKTETKDYYILKPVYQRCTVSTPVDNQNVVMRPVISREEAERIIDTIPSINAPAYNNKILRQLSEHYETSIKSFDCMELIKLTMSIYRKKKIAEEQKHKFGALDERYMKKAEDMLFGEFSVALGIDKNAVANYIAEKIAAIQGSPVSV